MPVYEYVCTACGHPIEVMHSFTAQGPQACERCGAPMRKALSTPAIVFKGSGWAKKDHRDKVHASSKAAAATPAATPGEGAGAAAPAATDGGTATPTPTTPAGPAAPAAPAAPAPTPAATPAAAGKPGSAG